MRGWMVAAIAAMMVGAMPGQATAQDLNLTGMVRTASLMDGIRFMCPGANKDTALKMRQAVLEAAVRSWGHKRTNAAFKKETDRRMAEVKATGIAPWCAYQRSHQANLGSGVFAP